MVNMSIQYEGSLHCKVTHGPSGTSITTDAPLDNGGQGASFSPTDLVGAALGACMITVMALVAERKKINLAGLTAGVSKEMIQSPARRIGKLEVVLHMPSGLSDSEKTLLERTAMTCPVHASLKSEVEIPVRFIYPENSAPNRTPS